MTLNNMNLKEVNDISKVKIGDGIIYFGDEDFDAQKKYEIYTIEKIEKDTTTWLRNSLTLYFDGKKSMLWSRGYLYINDNIKDRFRIVNNKKLDNKINYKFLNDK